MAQLRHRLLDRGLLPAALLLLAFLASCQMLFPPPLVITGSGPAAGRYASVNLPVWVEFSADLSHDKAEKGILFKENGATMEVRYSWTGNRVTITPSKGLSLGMRYDLSVAATVEDNQGNNLPSDFTLTFFTRLDDVRPTATITAPVNGATTSDPFQPITVTFSKAVSRSSFYSNLTISPSFKTAYTWGTGDLSCVITPMEALKSPTVYTVKVAAALADTGGNTLGSDVSSWFSEGLVAAGPAPAQVVKTVLNAATGAYTANAAFALTPVAAPAGAVTYDSGFERTWGLEVDFNKAVIRSGLESLVTVDPAWSFSIPYTQATVSQVQLVPTAPLTYGTIYTLTLHKGISDAAGNLSTADRIYRFKVDGPGSAPPALQSIAFHTNLVAPAVVTDPILGDHSTDYQTLHTAAFSNVASATYVDLSFAVATGADLDAASLMSHFSITATDANTVAAITAVGLPSPLGSSPQTIRVSFQFTKGGPGLIVFKLTAGLADSLGNVTAADQSWPVLE